LAPGSRGSPPRASSSDLDIGATLLAGGSASDATKALLAAEGAQRLDGQLRFFGLGRARLIASRSISWEDDRWARGAYAAVEMRVLCRRAHEHNLAGLYERRGRERAPRRGGGVCDHQTVYRVVGRRPAVKKFVQGQGSNVQGQAGE